jgi:hypothetical protein
MHFHSNYQGVKGAILEKKVFFSEGCDRAVQLREILQGSCKFYIAIPPLIDTLLDGVINRRLIHSSYLTSIFLSSSTNFSFNRI